MTTRLITPRELARRNAAGRLLSARLRLGLTQAELADYLGCDPRRVGAWERDEVAFPAWVLCRVEGLEERAA